MILPEGCTPGTEPPEVVGPRHPDDYLLVLDDLVIYHSPSEEEVRQMLERIALQDRSANGVVMGTYNEIIRQPEVVIRGRLLIDID